MGHNRVLVGVLSAGEPSLESSLASIHAQEEVEVEIIHVADRPQFEAHRELFAAFDERSADFDLIVKVDADMEIVNTRLFTALIAMFQRFPEHDLIPVAVDDWLSRTRIWGLNAWRGGVRWTAPPPALFVDRVPSTVRSAMSLLDTGAPLVLHATRPTTAQCLRYGAQRALKASALGTKRPFRRLDAIVAQAEAEPARERLLVLVAVERALLDAEHGRQLIESLPPPLLIEQAEEAVATASAQQLIEAARAAIGTQRHLHGLTSAEPQSSTTAPLPQVTPTGYQPPRTLVPVIRHLARAGREGLLRRRTPERIFAHYLRGA